MAYEKRCEVAACESAELVRINLESSWTMEKLFCPKCRRIYVVPTTLGKVTQVASLATIGIFALSLLTLDVESAADHIDETVSQFFDG